MEIIPKINFGVGHAPLRSPPLVHFAGRKAGAQPDANLEAAERKALVMLQARPFGPDDLSFVRTFLLAADRAEPAGPRQLSPASVQVVGAAEEARTVQEIDSAAEGVSPAEQREELRERDNQEGEQSKFNSNRWQTSSQTGMHIHALLSIPEPQDPIVLISVSNHYLDFLPTWHWHISRAVAGWRDSIVTAVAEDDAAESVLRDKYGFYVERGNLAEGVLNVSHSDLEFRSVGFKELTANRPLYIARHLAQRDVLYVDVDVAIFRNPFEELLAGKNLDCDIMTQADAPGEACTGFMFFRKNPNTVDFVASWAALLLQHPGSMYDQEAFNLVARNNSVRVCLFRRDEFMPGYMYFNRSKDAWDRRQAQNLSEQELWEQWQQGPVMAHNNFIVGHHAKKQRWIEYGLWKEDHKQHKSNVSSSNTNNTISLKVVVPVYNAQDYIGDCLRSLADQLQRSGLAQFDCVVIDDGSTDETYAIARAVTLGDARFQIVRNRERTGSHSSSVRQGAYLIAEHDTDVVVLLDGDDRLVHPRVLETITRLYSDNPRLQLTYGQNDQLTARPYSYHVLQTGIFRHLPCWATRLRKFRFGLFRQIRAADFLDPLTGRGWNASGDFMYMTAMLELLRPEQLMFIPQILYGYNRLNPLNDFRLHQNFQADNQRRMAAMPPYRHVYGVHLGQQLEARVAQPVALLAALTSTQPPAVPGSVLALQYVSDGDRGHGPCVQASQTAPSPLGLLTGCARLQLWPCPGRGTARHVQRDRRHMAFRPYPDTLKTLGGQVCACPGSAMATPAGAAGEILQANTGLPSLAHRPGNMADADLDVQVMAVAEAMAEMLLDAARFMALQDAFREFELESELLTLLIAVFSSRRMFTAAAAVHHFIASSGASGSAGRVHRLGAKLLERAERSASASAASAAEHDVRQSLDSRAAMADGKDGNAGYMHKAEPRQADCEHIQGARSPILIDGQLAGFSSLDANTVADAGWELAGADKSSDSSAKSCMDAPLESGYSFFDVSSDSDISATSPHAKKLFIDGQLADLGEINLSSEVLASSAETATKSEPASRDSIQESEGREWTEQVAQHMRVKGLHEQRLEETGRAETDDCVPRYGAALNPR
eukprot:g38875.t1